MLDDTSVVIWRSNNAFMLSVEETITKDRNMTSRIRKPSKTSVLYVLQNRNWKEQKVHALVFKYLRLFEQEVFENDYSGSHTALSHDRTPYILKLECDGDHLLIANMVFDRSVTWPAV